MITSASLQIGHYSDKYTHKVSIQSRRVLSQLLIAVLLLLSPITFSTDKIPNFTYECPVSTVCSVKTTRAVVHQRSPEVTPRQLPKSDQNIGFPTDIILPDTLIFLGSPCRAPPA